MSLMTLRHFEIWTNHIKLFAVDWNYNIDDKTIETNCK